MELPQYTLYLSLKRILLPKTFSLVFLGSFFYFGVWLNLLILNVYIPSEYHLYIVIGIGILLVLQWIINYIRFSNYAYLFYSDRIVFKGKKEVVIMLADIQGLDFRKDFLDKLFNTGTILLAPMHKMRYVGDTNQVYFYVQKLLEYSRRNIVYQRQAYPQQNYYYTPQIR